MAVEPNQERPQFFSEGQAFVNKKELVEKQTRFCIMDIVDAKGTFGPEWQLEIFCEGADELGTMTFAHGDPEKSKREQQFRELSQHPEYLPVHDCTLQKYRLESGTSGYRLIAKSGGGSCPCNPGETEVEILPDYPDEPEETAAPVDIGSQTPSMTQLQELMKLFEQLQTVKPIPATYAEVQELISSLNKELRARAPLVQHGVRGMRVEHGVPMR
jgi:hypothetical protein